MTGHEPAPTAIYKIVTKDQWKNACECGTYAGSADDRRDGFIHLSSARQLHATAAKHFRGKGDLLLVAIDPAVLGDHLKWEPSRGGDLFPHLYAPLDTTRALWTKPLNLGDEGIPELPKELLEC